MHMTIPSFTAAQLAAGAPGPETALTIGVLDGVHLGHQALLQRLRDEARKLALSPGVVTLHHQNGNIPYAAMTLLTLAQMRINLGDLESARGPLREAEGLLALWRFDWEE